MSSCAEAKREKKRGKRRGGDGMERGRFGMKERNGEGSGRETSVGDRTADFFEIRGERDGEEEEGDASKGSPQILRGLSKRHRLPRALRQRARSCHLPTPLLSSARSLPLPSRLSPLRRQVRASSRRGRASFRRVPPSVLRVGPCMLLKGWRGWR